MSDRATIADVARAAGVSIKTVSNVLNRTGSMRPETRDRVQQTMRELGYRVNMSARAMKTGGIGLLGLAITSFDQPFMPYLADSVVDAARRRGYGVVTDTYGYERGLGSIIAETQRLAADGWIFFASRPFADRMLLKQPYPLVVIGDYPVFGMVDAVTMPNEDAVCDAVGRLLDRGCRTIALIGGLRAEHDDAGTDTNAEANDDVEAGRSCESSDEASTGGLRTRGYRRAHRDRGLPVDERLIRPTSWVQTGGRDAVAALLDDPGCGIPDALMCLNDAMAIGAIHELQRRGIRVPQDVQVCGFDDVPDGVDGIPALTTIDPHVNDYADHAVDLLLRRIQGSRSDAQVYTTHYELVVRESALANGRGGVERVR